MTATSIDKVVGIDEAGRGPLAGPVYAAAVILPGRYDLPGLTDSKMLSKAQRDRLALSIKQQAISWSVAKAEVLEIDELNIVIGSGIRDNVSQDESYSIWEIYKKYLPLNSVKSFP